MTPTDALKLRPAFAHYRRSHSLLHEEGTGRLIEYRRIFTPDHPVIFLEHRVLGPGGNPYPDGWYLVGDRHHMLMSYTAADVLRELSELKE